MDWEVHDMPPRFGTEEFKDEYARHNRRIAARIRDARLEAHLTQEELAKAIGREKTWLSAIELSRNGISTLDLENIARETGKRISQPEGVSLSGQMVPYSGFPMLLSTC